jgi:fructose/tagatose bisphosphate aldolase
MPHSPSAGRAEGAAPVIIIHSLEHARAALAAATTLAVPVTLASAPGAGGYAGPAWFAALVETARAEFPGGAVSALLDCGEEPGTVLAAFRHGIRLVRFAGSATAAARLLDIAGPLGAVIERGEIGPALDLLDCGDPEAACRAHLSGNAA